MSGIRSAAVCVVPLVCLYLLLQHVVLAQADTCPCSHCGPPMCTPLCQLNCLKCCTCCVYFEARIGKRSGGTGYGRWETKGQLDFSKRGPNKEISVRLSILRKSEGRVQQQTNTDLGMVQDGREVSNSQLRAEELQRAPLGSQSKIYTPGGTKLGGGDGGGALSRSLDTLLALPGVEVEDGGGQGGVVVGTK